MTLLIGVVSSGGIILAADGLTMDKSSGKPISTNTQKLFPLTGRPLAFAHHGQNIIAGQPVATLLNEIEQALPSSYTVRTIAEQLASTFSSRVQGTLSGLAASGIRDGCGFWVAGYGTIISPPDLYEVWWSPDMAGVAGPVPVVMKVGPIVLGGDGQAEAKEAQKSSKAFDYTPKLLRNNSLNWWSNYTETLYSEANKRRKAPIAFGGNFHALQITAAGGRWQRRP